jgi:hypothetical protein
MLLQFACDSCGGASIMLPRELTDEASVRCKGCGRLIATWAEFKESATRAILASPRLQLSADPLAYDERALERKREVQSQDEGCATLKLNRIHAYRGSSGDDPPDNA